MGVPQNILSIGFEFLELTFRHMLPNFNECWWDSIILDILICNWFGICIIRYFDGRTYEWVGISRQPNIIGKVEERAIEVEELIDADEVFCTGTVVVVAPVGSITFRSKRYDYKTGAGTTSVKLSSILTFFQSGRIEDKMGWTVELD